MKWNDSDVSLHTAANMFTFEFLVRWALRSVRDAIAGYQREQLRRHTSSDSSGESVRSTVKSATTTSSEASARAVVAAHKNRFK